MKFTVLGKSPAWQDVDGACSGYLVTEGGTALLVDCGNGVFGKLRKFHDYVDIDTIVISHLHADHFFDLVPYAFALIHAPRQQPVPVDRWPGTDDPARPRLLGPPGSREVFERVASLWGLQSLIGNAFDVHEYDPDETVRVGEMTIEFRAVPHFIETYAIGVTGPGGQRVTYGADCRPNEALVEFGRDTDLMVAEATLPRPERTGVRGHLTPGEAGQHAAAAGARRLLLTHISDELDPAWALAEAEARFAGPAEVASEGLEIAI